MEKELVKKILKTTNFTTTEIYRLIDLYKETTSVTASNFKNCVLFFCGKLVDAVAVVVPSVQIETWRESQH